MNKKIIEFKVTIIKKLKWKQFEKVILIKMSQKPVIYQSLIIS